jgi:GntR family transcriptional repressor for pyruvate dehydrogenase complex
MPTNSDSPPTLGIAAPRSGPPKASSYLADELRAHIIGNDLAIGDRLPSEAELIERFSLSRATVREALRLLESEGLIAIKRGPNGGITATRPNPAHISRTLATMVGFSQVPLRDLFDFRMAVEPPAAAAAAARITPEEAVLLHEAAQHHDHDTQDRVDFHLLIGRLSHNAFFDMILSALDDVIAREVDFEPLTEEDNKATIRAHVKIAEAIASGDPRKAETSMRRHLERFAERMQEEGRLEAPIIPRAAWRRGARGL